MYTFMYRWTVKNLPPITTKTLQVDAGVPGMHWRLHIGESHGTLVVIETLERQLIMRNVIDRRTHRDTLWVFFVTYLFLELLIY